MSICEFDYKNDLETFQTNPEIIESRVKSYSKMTEFLFLISIVIHIGTAVLFFFLGWNETWHKVLLSFSVIITAALYIFSFIKLIGLFSFKKTFKIAAQGSETKKAYKNYKIYKFCKFDWTCYKKIN
ncbi:hypothetical protein KQ872_00780 [Mycoplasma sp. ES3225-GEN-MYC]|uniref:hypothetical protein n=1 Tax=Mycoplasma miroungigenitalium TaxID=754515 RepID=UPI001C10A0A2|nr:hypothetical protein [Mycoplasma miroungigenitalium]MBU4691505.1 hypothetical protein [Mycoplasma miroungigenitalium]